MLAGSRLSETARIGLGVGVLGGFTTFSTFSLDTFHLLRTDRPGAALAYVAASFAFGVGAAAAGWTLTSR
jgi:CrcB protein